MRPPLYLYAFSATLNLQNTLELRRFLFEQGFMIRLDNLITGEVSVLHADDLKNDDIIMKLDPALTSLAVVTAVSSLLSPKRSSQK